MESLDLIFATTLVICSTLCVSRSNILRQEDWRGLEENEETALLYFGDGERVISSLQNCIKPVTYILNRLIELICKIHLTYP